MSPFRDPIERKLAPALQLILVTLLAASLFTLVLALLVVGERALSPRSLAPTILFVSAMAAAIYLLRNGHFKAALGIVVAGVMLSLTNSLLSNGLHNNRELLLVAALPITIAGLLMGRRALLVVTFIIIVLIVIASTLVIPAAPPVDTPELATARLVYFIMVIGLLAFFIDLFGNALREALNTSLERERALDEQREYLQVTLSSIGDAVIATDTSGKITFLNPIAEALTGWSQQEVIGRPIEDIFNIINEFTRARAENPVQRVLQEGVIVGLANHTLLIARDGRESPIADSGAPIRTSSGEIIGSVLVFRDTTEEHQAELALKESENRFRTMADNAPVLIWLAGLDKKRYYFNKQWLNFTGRTLEQESGNGWTDGIHPDDYETCIHTYTAAFDERHVFSMEYRLRRHDGEYRWLLAHGTPRFDEAGEFLGYIGSCVDITERKQVQADLAIARNEAEAARLNLHNLFMEAPALIGILKGREGRVELFNPRFTQLWGGRPVIGKTMREAWPELEGQGYYEMVERVFDSGEPVYGNEYPGLIDRNNDGQLSTAYFNFVYQATHDAAGKIDGVAIYGVEVTDQVVARKRAEENEALLNALFATAPFGLIFFDRDLRYQRVNRALATMNGLTPEQHVGKTVAELLPHITEKGRDEVFREVLDTRKPVEFEEVGETPAAPGEQRHWLASYYPVTLRDELLGIGAIVLEITERKRSELRTRLLQEVTAALSEAVTPQQVAEAIVTRGIKALGADIGYVSRVGKDGYAELLNTEDIAPQLLERFARIPLDASTPMTDAIRNGKPIWLESLDEYREHYPEIFQNLHAKTRTEALIFLPLVAHGSVIGGMGMSFTKPYKLDAEERNFLLLLANQCAQALERAHLYEAETQSRQQAERNAGWIARLQEVTAALSGALTLNEVAEVIVHNTMTHVDARRVALVLQIDQETFVTVRAAGMPEGYENDWGRFPADPDLPITDVVRKQQPLWFETNAEREALYPATAAFTGLYNGAWAMLPLEINQNTVGALCLNFPIERPISQEDRLYMMTIAEQCSQAMERARLYETEAHRAQQLQKLSEAALVINSVLSIEETLSAVTDQARQIIGVHQAVASLTIGDNWEQSITAVSLSEKYLKWSDYKAIPDGSGIYRLVCETNQPMRLTQEELVAHPAWRGFGKDAAFHPPMRGWLAAPLTSRDGENMGLVQLSDRYQGEFTEEDEAILVQLAQMASIALENIRLSNQAQEAAAYEERQRLARDLHDAVSQTLFSSTTIAEALPPLWERKPESAFKQLHQMVTLNRAAMAEMRSLLLELRPDSIIKTSMRQLLTQLIEAAKGRKRIDAQLDIQGHEGELPPDVHIAFYRIAQESINNILKHSQATEFRVELRCLPEAWTLRITDNGRGFNPGQNAGGIGLHSMRERAEKINATLHVRSAPQQGTENTLVWQTG
jgi:PAS domain S-box-containing protein